MSKINKVYIYENGMTMVFDQLGKQMGEYQGLWIEKRDTIERAIIVAGETVDIVFNTRWKYDDNCAAQKESNG